MQQTATEHAYGISGEQLRVIDRYVVPMLLDLLDPKTSTEASNAADRLRGAAVAALRSELWLSRLPGSEARCSGSIEPDRTCSK